MVKMSPRLRLRLLQYGLPFVVVILVAYIKIIFLGELHESVFLLFFSAVLVSGWYGTLRSGLIATVISGILANYLFITPAFIFKIDAPSLLNTGIFFIEGTLFSIIIKSHSISLKKIAETSERFRIVAEGINDYVIMILDPSGRIQNINKTTEQILGYKKEELVDFNFSHLYTSRDRRKHLPRKHLLQAINKGHKDISGWRLNKNSKPIWIQGKLSVIKNKEGNVKSLIAIFKDITKQKKQEREREDFISVATHELKQPVTSIKLLAQLLAIEIQKGKDIKAASLSQSLIEQINKMEDLLNFLLDLTRIQTGKIALKKEKFKLQDLFKQIETSIKQTYPKYKLVITNYKNTYVLADKERIRQVIVNLLTNAIKYSPESNLINLTTIRKKSTIIISVRDFGIGIAKNQQEMIFNRFYRVGERKTQVSGLGLGLYITSEILKKHTSRLCVESSPGKGSTFYFTLPLAR